MRRGGWLALAWMIAGACGDDDDEAWKDKPRLAERAEDVRQLDFAREVKSETLTQEEFRARVEADVSGRTEEDLRELADTYGRLGFFDVNLDLRPVLTQSRVDATGAFYSFGTNQITLIGTPEDDVVVHEYVHALQDQAFDLGRYDLETSDGFLARRAVVEGDATLAAGAFLVEEQSGGRAGVEDIDFDGWIAGWRGFTSSYLADSDYPIVFRAYTSFAYTYGLIYSADNLLGLVNGGGGVKESTADWRLQDELFTQRAPATSAEILGQDDAVVEVGLANVPSTLAPRLEKTDWDTLGAWYAYLLVRPVAGVDAERIRDAWDGDRALFARDRQSGAAGVLWVSLWDDEVVAARVETALHAIHDPAGEPLTITRRGAKVVLARNFGENVAPALVEAAFAGASKPVAARSRPALLAREKEIPCLFARP